MLDNVMNSLRRGVERARVRGEEVAQTTRLRFEVYSLSRELDALYGRLGRAYHSGADVAVLQPIRDEIARLDEEITARERLIAEISAGEALAATEDARVRPSEPTPAVPLTKRVVIAPAPTPVPGSPTAGGAVEPTPPASVGATPGVPSTEGGALPSAASVWGSLQQERAGAPDLRTPPTPGKAVPMDSSNRGADNRDDQPNQDYQDRVDEGQNVSRGGRTDADLHGSDAPIPPLGTLAGNAQGIDRPEVASHPNVKDTEVVHDRILQKEERIEADRASANPDPLDQG
ncbi:hypothetical protein [Deinococcus pimensis]|uniref:hypothetical protein n=1 Tax=Deinococcus pimensis TaxID=309888 RepID=UPI0004AD8EFF|nr:hypothetical protein [Deinococcus pimensis]